MRELFVWYRVAGSQAGVAKAEVLEIQRGLMAEHPGLAAGLFVRHDGSEAAQTWMETYACADSPAGVDRALERSIEDRASSLDAVIEGRRQVEAFERVRR